MANIMRTGNGKPGYCKLCSFDNPKDQDEFDKRTGLKEDGKYPYTPKKLNVWLSDRGLQGVTRNTVYNHREHVAHPKDRIISAVAKRTRDHGVQPAMATEQEFLDSLITIGRDRIAANPEEVTIDQALKATQIKTASSKKGNQNALLVNIFTSGPGETSAEVIEGEYTEDANS